ncbi:hypothetical protein ABEF92_007124 [Exophiala dermatitidis]
MSTERPQRKVRSYDDDDDDEKLKSRARPAAKAAAKSAAISTTIFWTSKSRHAIDGRSYFLPTEELERNDIWADRFFGTVQAEQKEIGQASDFIASTEQRGPKTHLLFLIARAHKLLATRRSRKPPFGIQGR